MRTLDMVTFLVFVVSLVAAFGQPPQPLQPVASTNMTLGVTCSAQDVYVGQPVTFRFAWDCSLPWESIKAVDIRIPLLRDRAFKEVPYAPAKTTPDPGTIGLPLNNTRAIGTREGSRIRFEKAVVPLVEGVRTIPASTLACSVVKRKAQDGFQYPSYFDNQFFDSDGNVHHRREFVATKPVVLRVLPLPSAGRPAGFSGLVGACSLAAEVRPAVAQVGDPLTLKLIVSGHSHPEIIPMPELSTDPAFLEDFEFAGDAAAPLTRKGARVFRYTLRPRHDSVTEIPSVALSFFNAETRSYRTASSEAVPIKVRDAEIVNAYDGVLSDGTRLKNTIRLKPGGIVHDHADVSVLTGSKSVWGISRSWSWMLLLLPPLLYGLLRMATAESRLARRDPAAARAKRAYRAYRRRMGELTDREDPPSEETVAACDRALRDYLADRFNLTAGALTFHDVAQALEAQGLTADDRKSVHDTMRAHSAMLYADPVPPLPGDTPTPRSLSRIVARLEGLFSLLLLLLIPASTLLASPEPPTDSVSPAELLVRAQAHMTAAHDEVADPERARALYATAAATYQHVLDRGIRNGHLYYNLGNAWYWAGDRGRALLNYRRAELYLPGNVDVLHNIAFVRSESRDAISPSLLSLCEKYLLFRDARLHRRLRGGMIACGWTAMWVFLAIAMFRQDRRLTKAVRMLAVCVVALVVSSLVDATLVSRVRRGVILDRQVIGRKGNAHVYEPAFNTPLHAGTECRIIDVQGDWTRVRLRNGYQCWILSSSIGAV